MELFTVEHLPQMSLEITLGICIKLFCDNGRVHWRDLANDLLFWLPGLQQLPGDGLGRQIAAADTHPSALAAK